MLTPSLVALILFGAVFIFVIILHTGFRKVSKRPASSSKKASRSNTGGGGNGHKNSTESRCCCATCCALCYIFCCPPCPCCITAKIAFRPPPSSYSIESGVSTKSGRSASSKKKAGGGGHLRMGPSAQWQFSKHELNQFSAFYVSTSRGAQMACLYLAGESKANPKYTLLFSHGNATDLGQMASFYYILSRLVGVNIFSYDYDGYGASSGSPSERNIYADIDAAYKTLLERFGVSSKKVILYGQSIGSAPTIDLASRTRSLGGVIIQSGLSSACRVFCPSCTWCRCCDSFLNISKVSDITAPVLVIHGTDDTVIPIDHGIQLYQEAPRTVDACWIQDAGHNDLVIFSAYFERMKRYLGELEQIEKGLLDI